MRAPRAPPRRTARSANRAPRPRTARAGPRRGSRARRGRSSRSGPAAPRPPPQAVQDRRSSGVDGDHESFADVAEDRLRAVAEGAGGIRELALARLVDEGDRVDV